MTKHPPAVVLSFADLAAALRAKWARDGKPDTQARPLGAKLGPDFGARDCFAEAADENAAMKDRAAKPDDTDNSE